MKLLFLLISISCIDLNAPDAADTLIEGPREPKIDSAWSPYESKMVR